MHTWVVLIILQNIILHYENTVRSGYKIVILKALSVKIEKKNFLCYLCFLTIIYFKIIFWFFVGIELCAIISLAVCWNVYLGVADKSEHFDSLKSKLRKKTNFRIISQFSVISRKTFEPRRGLCHLYSQFGIRIVVAYWANCKQVTIQCILSLPGIDA